MDLTDLAKLFKSFKLSQMLQRLKELQLAEKGIVVNTFTDAEMNEEEIAFIRLRRDMQA